MAKLVKKIVDRDFPTNGEVFSIPGRHAKNAGLASYKAKRRGIQLDSGVSQWPEDSLNSLLYEMSTDSSDD